MAFIKLRNNTKSTSRIGFVVIIDPRDKNSFIYAPADSTNVLGIITESKPYRELCEIATSGVAQVYVSGNTQKGSIIRSRKSNETVSAGACKVAKTTDTPFFMIGTALEAGKGLVPVNLSFAYISSGGGGGIQSIVAGNDITVDNTDPLNPIVATSGGIDGGFADSIYLIDQIIDGGNA
jgi:hypothetical protein